MAPKTWKIRTFAACACILLSTASIPAFSQTSLSPTTGKFDLGVIFNTGDILMNLSEYQAGLGLKLGNGKFAYRAMADLSLSANTTPGSALSFSIIAGLAIEYHILPAPISPYIGAAASAGFIQMGTTATSFPLSAGAILGIEVFPFDFLSAFVEYTVAADFNIVTDTATGTTTSSILLDTRMGNNAKIGIVFYFMRAKKK